MKALCLYCNNGSCPYCKAQEEKRNAKPLTCSICNKRMAGRTHRDTCGNKCRSVKWRRLKQAASALLH